MGRAPCCSKHAGLNRGAWSAGEDMILCEYIRIHGEGSWKSLPQKAGLKRCGKSCRLRWLNYLRPDIKRGNISPDEEELIIRMHGLLGNRWSLIAGRLPGRTDNEVKNYWNTCLSRKLANNGCFASKSKNINGRSKSPSPRVEDLKSKTTPLRITPVRITKRHNIIGDSGIVGHQNINPEGDGTEITNSCKSLCDLFVDELMEDGDLEFMNFTVMENTVNAESPSTENNGLPSLFSVSNPVHHQFPHSAQCELNTSKSSLYFNKASVPECDLLPSPFDCSRNFAVEKLDANKLDPISLLDRGMQYVDPFRVSDEQEMEEMSNTWQVNSLDGLQ
uniref:Uncharacterized protein n=1 Tax=Araucaria cunninghamii TaxID=56994 RepID=A0A0D6R592_ARACU